MEPLVFGLVALAALLHASWNALIKVQGDRLVALTLMNGSAGLLALAALPFLSVPDPASWPYLLASAGVHLLYYVFLVLSYRHGDLSLVYPAARGSAPLLVALGGFLLANERLSPSGVAAVALISAGILTLTRPHGSNPHQTTSVVFALLTGLTIAAYTLLDGLGGRATANAWDYVGWLFVLDTLPLFGLVLWLRRSAFLTQARAVWKPAVVSGALSLTAYGLVIWAMSRAPMAQVSALRETSVIFAALIGTRLLHEPLGRRRTAAAAIVALGVALLQLAAPDR